MLADEAAKAVFVDEISRIWPLGVNGYWPLPDEGLMSPDEVLAWEEEQWGGRSMSADEYSKHRWLVKALWDIAEPLKPETKKALGDCRAGMAWREIKSEANWATDETWVEADVLGDLLGVGPGEVSPGRPVHLRPGRPVPQRGVERPYRDELRVRPEPPVVPEQASGSPGSGAEDTPDQRDV